MLYAGIFCAVLFCNEIGTLLFEKRTFLLYAAFPRSIAPHRFYQTFRSENRFVRKAVRRVQLPGKRSRTKKIGCPEKNHTAADAVEASRYIGFLISLFICIRYSLPNITVEIAKKIRICLCILRIDGREKSKYTENS